MKKIALFFAALVVAMASFAAIPTKSDLAPYYEPGQLCVCVQFEEQVCNDIVFAGSYNAWNTIPAEMAHFAPLKGFDGWYYVAVTDNSTTIEGKPVQLRSDGSFSWDYQGGDAKAWTIHSGYVNILPGYNGECDLKNYATAEPIIMTCAYFKNHNTPCGQVVVSQTYTIRLKAPACIGADGTFYEPAIIGSFNGWAEGIAADHIDRNTSEYVFLIKDAVGSEFKFKALGDTDWTNEIQLQDELGNWYNPQNITLGTDTEISIDYSAGRYTKCVEDVVVEDPIKDYTIRLLAPDCIGEDGTHYEPAIIGTFNDWTVGVAANYIDDKTGEYVFLITDSVGGAFKFRALGDTDWSNQIQLLDEEYGWWYDNYDQILGTDTEIHIDYSMGKYTLCVDDVVNDSIKTYTIRLLAPNCAGADGTHYEPAIIGSFNDWTEGMAANYIDDSTGEYVFLISDKEGGEFKFKALGDTDWTNEIQLQDELGNWYNPQNLPLESVTEIRIDYSAGRYTLCVEDAPHTSDIPTNADLAPYYEPGQLCVCIKFEEQVCNDIVFAGSYNAWNTIPAEMAHFAPLKGFDGWYYVAVTDNSATIEGKPVQLKADGSFSWDYQGGDAKAWTIHSGYVDILPGYNGECDLKNYANAEPIIMTCAYFKNHNSPCEAEVHQDYTIRLLAPSCAGADGTHYQPAIIGDFNNWTEGIAANDIDEETHEYVFLINAMAGSSFKFRALGDTDWSNEIILWDEISQYWYAPANIVLGTDTEISIDYSAGRYTKCVEDVIEDPIKDYTIRLLAPDCAGEDGTHYEPAIIGSFNDWTVGVAANYIDDKTGEYVFHITDSVGGAFKFRALGDTDWSNQIQLYDEEYGWWYDNYDLPLGNETEISIDYSTGRYTFCVEDVVVEDSIKAYTIRLLAPDCAGADGTHYEPAIIGSFNDWTEGVAANYIDDSTGEYVFLISDKEGGEFKFKALGDTDWTNEIQLQDELGNWYNPQNLTLGTDTEIRIDYSAGRYTKCVEDVVVEEPIKDYTIRLLAPDCAGADGTHYEPAIVGSFNDWTVGVAANYIDDKTGEYVFHITDSVGGAFKFRALGDTDWSNQIQLYDEEYGWWYDNYDQILGTDTEIHIDYSMGKYTLCVDDVVNDSIKTYTIRLLAPDCAGADGTHYKPAIIGTFNDWTEGVAANYIDEWTGEYIFTITDKVGGEFKFKALGDTDWTNEIQLQDKLGNWYNPQNLTLGTDTEISIDYSAGRYTKCVEDVVVEDPIKDYTIRLLAPDCAGADGTHYKPAIVGSFNDWTVGVAANYIDDKTGEYVFLITDSVGGAFKFRALGDTDWSNQIQLYDEEYGWWYDNYDLPLGNETEISIDYSTGRYTFCVEDVVVEDSIKAYTIRLLAPDCAGADGTHYEPAIIGTFNDWTEGVAANYIDEWTGEYVFLISDKEGGEFKFKALGDIDWTNEIQLQDELGNWYNPQNLTLGTDTEIRIDYSAGRYTLCQEEIITLDPEYVTICYGETYYWNGDFYHESGVYTVQIDNFIHTLYLTVLPEAFVSEENLTITESELPYTWHNLVLSAAGDYYDAIPYVQTGCDSIVYILHLNVEPAVVANQCGDNLYWTYEPSTQELSITGYGDMYDYTAWTQPWNTIAHTIRHITLPEGMISIGTSAFADCMYTPSIAIPASVEIIADRAFENCRMLSDLTFAEGGALNIIGNWAFYNCHELKHIAIPEGVTEIGYAAFYGCTYLSEITLPASMEYIADNGFALCAKLTSMTVNASVPPTVAARTFEDVDRTIPVYVPQESVDLYKAAPVWQEFYIVGKVASSLENQPAATDNCQKLIRDGQLIIIHDGKTYNAMGQEL